MSKTSGLTAGRLVLIAFVAEAVLAGGNAVAIRFSNRELGPLWGATMRFGIAAMILGVALVSLRVALPRGRALAGAVAFGLFQFAGAFGLYYYALVELHAGLGQTLLALVPLATLGLAIVQGQERLVFGTAAGALIGLLGVGLISQQSVAGSVSAGSLLAVFGSILCFAQALVIARRLPHINPIALNAVGMSVSVPVLLAASLISREEISLPQLPETWLALSYVTAVGSVVVFLLHIYVVQQWSASRTSYVMVLIPVVTVLLSARLDDEPIGTGLILGGSLVILGVYVGALRRSTREPVAPMPSGH